MIDYLIDHKRDTYAERANPYDELLEIYREAGPRLDQKQTLDDILEYAKVTGYSLDPKYLIKVRDVGVDKNPHLGNSERAEATEAFRNTQES